MEPPLASYVAVLKEGATDLTFHDATTTCAVPGAVVHALEDQALTDGVIAVGDVLSRVNHVDVLGMAYSDVMGVVKDEKTPQVFEFVPRSQIGDVQRLVAHRERLAAAQRTVESRYAILRRGYMYVQDRSPLSIRKWKKLYVVLRVSGIQCLEDALAVSLWSELSLAGKRCEVRVLPSDPNEVVSESPSVVVEHALELRVDDDVWVLVLASEADQVAWRDALTLAFEVSKAVPEEVEKNADETVAVPQLDSSQAMLLSRLLVIERDILRDQSIDPLSSRRVRWLKTRMRKLGRVYETHAIQNFLRD